MPSSPPPKSCFEEKVAMVGRIRCFLFSVYEFSIIDFEDRSGGTGGTIDQLYPSYFDAFLPAQRIHAM